MSGITNFRPSGGLGYEPTEYTATKSYTARCGAGTVGSDVTRDATRTSFLGQNEADALALQAAKAEAEAALVCTVVAPPNTVTYTATKSATATCPAGQVGPDVTRTETRTSTVNQAAADSAAYQAAAAAAQAALVCTVPWGVTLTGPSDEGAGITLTSGGAEKLRYNGLSSGDSLPVEMGVSVGGTQVAGVVFLARYLGQPFEFEHAGNTYQGVFTNGNIPF